MRLVTAVLAAITLPAAANAQETRPPVTITVAGDIMAARGAAPAAARGKTNLDLYGSWCKSADFAFANLEGAALTSEMRPRRNQLLFEPSALTTVRKAGFGLLSIANNHALDGGEAGFARTRQVWIDLGGRIVGDGPPVRFNLNGQSICWLASTAWGPFRSGRAQIQPLVPESLLAQVRQLSGQGETVFVSLHWGQEYRAEPDAGQRAFAHALIDAGVAAVIGHHTHVAGPVELYKGRPIFYCLGNFVFDRTPRPQSGSMGLIRLEDGHILARATAVQPDATAPGPKLPLGETVRQALPGHFLPDSAPQQVVWSLDGKGLHHLRLFVWDGKQWSQRASGTHPAIEQLRTGDVDGDGEEEVWLQLRQRSKLDVTIQKRLHIYRAGPGQGFRPVWRGSGLSRPFRQWVPLYRTGSWATDLVALETDPRPDYSEFQWLSLYRWNGFGFRRIWDHPVRGRVELKASDVPVSTVRFTVTTGGQKHDYLLWSAPNGANLAAGKGKPPIRPPKAE